MRNATTKAPFDSHEVGDDGEWNAFIGYNVLSTCAGGKLSSFPIDVGAGIGFAVTGFEGGVHGGNGESASAQEGEDDGGGVHCEWNERERRK